MVKDVFIITLDEKERQGRLDVGAVFHAINQLLGEGVPVCWTMEDFQAEGRSYPAGSFFIKIPFAARRGIPCNTVMAWLEDKMKGAGINAIGRTGDIASIRSKMLIAPKIALYYDGITYDNALMHYIAFRSMGFPVMLIRASDLLKDACNPESFLSQANVFVMPGGSMHFSSFAGQKDAAVAIENIRSFIRRGGGYIGVCAGATEALMKSPYPYLNLVDASYHAEWFTPGETDRGDWEWRTLLGPLLLEIVQPSHPIMFGYGENAVLPGYGPQVAVEYFGGPGMFKAGPSVKVLARYSAPIGQKPCRRVEDIWGSAAAVTTHFGSGRVVLFGPHPEWPGSCHRMYAQALYYAARLRKPSSLDEICRHAFSGGILSASIHTDAVQSMLQTAAQAAPVLDRCIKTCQAIVDLGAGDRRDPLGVWYDRTMLTYAKAIKLQMEESAKSAQVLYHEYERLGFMKARFSDNPRALQWTAEGMSTIEQFFAYAASLPVSDLLPIIIDLEKEIREIDLPCIERYVRLLHHCRGLLEACTVETCTDEVKPEVRESLAKLQREILSWQPPGHMYRAMSTLRHTLDIMQYRIDIHLLNLLRLADQANDVLSLTDPALQEELSSELRKPEALDDRPHLRKGR